MKTKIFTLLLLALPFLVSAQTLTIASGATVTIGPGASMTTGTFNNEAGVGGMLIQSDATGQGTFIFDTDGANGTNATVQIFVPEGTADHHWHFVAPMTTNAKARDFFYDDAHDAWLYRYQPDVSQGDAWKPTVDLDSLLPLGSGYSYIWRTNPPSRENVAGTVTFEGPLSASALSVSLTLGTDSAQSFNLIGNPYSSTIDLEQGPGSSTGLEKTFWIWDRVNNQYAWGSYTTITYPGEDILHGLVAMGQAFFLRATAAGAHADFDPQMRVPDNTAFYKKSNADEDYANHLKLVASNGDYTDKIFVTFAEDGSEDFEDGDVTKLFGGVTAPQLYLPVQDRKQSINYIASLSETEERIVPFNYRAGKDGEQTFTFTTQYLLDTYVLLEDTKTGIKVDIMNKPVYTFTASKEDNEDRFLLHFNWSPTGIENPAAEQLVGIYSYDKTVYISNKDNSFTQTSTISIHDMYGRLLYSNDAVLGATTKIPVQASNTYLVVRVKNASGIYTNKVFIK